LCKTSKVGQNRVNGVRFSELPLSAEKVYLELRDR
jgi:hypothetical protein